MDSFIDGTYRVFRLGLRWIVGYGASILMLGITGLAIMEIVRRYIFGVVYEWSQDAVTYGMVAAIFLFFAVTQARPRTSR
jgi:TRAP-type C4-dicarboxylate transport system permease small subunit